MKPDDMQAIVRLAAKGILLDYVARVATGQPADATQAILEIENLYANPDLHGLPIDIKEYRNQLGH